MNRDDKKRILLVEDEAITAMLEKQQLEKYGYSVHHVTTGEDAVKTILDNTLPIDLILMDINLGSGIDGTQAAKQILNHNDIPVVFLSSHNEPEVVAKTEKVTSYGYVVKISGIFVLNASIKMAFKLFEAKTKEKKHEQALRLSEEKYKGLIEGLNDAVYRMTLPDGRYEYFSSSVEEVFGYTSEKFINDPLFVQKIIHPEYAGYFKEKWKELLEGNVQKKYEYKIIDSKGNERWIIQSNKAIFNDSGKIKAIEGLCRNVTDLKKSEQALHESELLLKSTVDGMSAHIVVLDDRGEIILANKSYRDFAEMNGVDPVTVSVGTNYLAVCDSASGQHSVESKPFAKGIREIISGKRQSFELEYPCHSADENRWFIGRITPFPGEVPRRVIIAHENITKRKQSEVNRAESEKLLSRAQKISHTGSWKLDLTTKLLTWSDEVYRIFGCEPQEFAATYEAFLDAVHPDDRAAVDKAYSNSLKEASDGYEIEHRIVRRNSGDVRHVHERCFHERDNAGNIIQSIGMVQDITDRKQDEKKLQESESRLSATLHSIGDGVITTDATGNVTSLNKVAEHLTGWTTPEVAGKPVDEIFHIINAHTREKAVNPMTRAIKEGVIVGLANDTVLIARNGTEHQIADSCAPIKDNKGNVLGTVLVFCDVTEDYHRREALRESEEKFRSIFAFMTEMVVLHELVGDEDNTPVNYRIIECNPAFTQITGIKRDEAVGRLATDVYGSDSAPYLDEYARVALTGEPCTFTTAYSPIDKHFEIHAASPGKNMFVTVTTDITDRKRAELYHDMGRKILQILNEPGDLPESIQRVLTALKTQTGADAVGLRLQEGEDFPYYAQDGFSKDFLLTENTLVERGKDGGVCRDNEGNVSLECTCGLVISGQTDPAHPLFTKGGSCWTNDSFPLLDLPSDQDPRLHPRNNCIHQGYASVALIPIRIQDQMYSRETCIRNGFSSMAQVPVRASDRIVGLIQINDKRKGRFTLETIEILEVIATHIGSALMRKRAEEALVKAKDAAETANKAKSEFLSVMSHELRTPLNPILGFTELLVESPNLTEEQRNWLSIINQRGKDLLDLIKSVLDLAKIEAKQVEIKPQQMALRATIRSLFDTIRPLADKKGLRIDWLVEPEVLDDYLIDGLRFRQILLNLLNNALKFTTAGSITMRVQRGNSADISRPLDKDETVLLFSLKDTGIGVPKDRQSAIFDNFTQADHSHAVDYGGGAGLGLSIVRQLTELLGGKIWMESHTGQGSTFFFTIIFGVCRADPIPDTVQEEQRAISGKSLKILIVEDDQASAMLAEYVVRHAGHTTRTAHDGRQALALLAEEPFDVVLMDVEMPVMDGLTATRRIREAGVGGYGSVGVCEDGHPQTHTLTNPHTSTPRIPIIAMTANAMQDDREKCIAAGMNAYISKPVAPRALAAALEQLLTGKSEDRSQKVEEPSPMVFDRAGLLQRKMDDDKHAQNLMALFVETIPKYIATLHNYLNADDLSGVVKMAHKIKGTAATLGGEETRIMASDMEQTAKAGDLNALRSQMDELEAAADRLVQAIQNG